MKDYVPDPEKWARYFDRKREKGQVTILGSQPRIISIENAKEREPPQQSVQIEAVTPVQRENERVESELRRVGALPTKKRKRQQGGGGVSHVPRLKRLSNNDTSGF